MSDHADPPEDLDADALALAHRMFDLARDGDSQLIAYVEAGVPVNLTDPQGNTLLMLAAYYGQAELVAELAARGADPDRVNDRGQTPLAGGVFKDSREVITALMDAGADPYAGTPSAVETAQFFELQELLPMLTPSSEPND